jgi:hypothetical protein
MQQELENGPGLAADWSVVKDWKESSRYERQNPKKGKDMLDAIAKVGGVFECIKKYW